MIRLTTPVLERVFSSWTSTGYSAWQQYYHLTKSRLHGYRYPLAGRRLEQVASLAEEQICSAENGKALIRKYTWSYFSDEFTGLGMPKEKGEKSWDRVMLPPRGAEAQMLIEERPPTAKEAAASPLHSASGSNQPVFLSCSEAQPVAAVEEEGHPRRQFSRSTRRGRATSAKGITISLSARNFVSSTGRRRKSCKSRLR